MTDWLALALAVLGFVTGWILADLIATVYSPRGRAPSNGGT